ncbi:MAG: PulJ/GspJ family protein [Mycobacteriales bacterium]
MNRLRPRRSLPAGDGGVTLVELLVALTIATLVWGLLMVTLVSSQHVDKATTSSNDLTAEARTALNRISEDLQQAVPLTTLNGAGQPSGTLPAIIAATNPDGPNFNPTAVTSFTFQADFNGTGCVNGVSVETANISPAVSASPCPASPLSSTSPDIETVCWGGSANPVLYLIAGGVQPTTCTPDSGGAQPLLSGKVASFEAFYRSNLYLYDTDHDGITTWYDLDAAGPPVGNNNGILDSPELGEINGVLIRMTVSENGDTQVYSTEVNLRNVP